MFATTFIRPSSLLRASAVSLALTLAAPVVHAAPAAPRKASAAKKPGKRPRVKPTAAEVRAGELNDALAKAASERDQARARVQPLLFGGRHERAANHLLEAALMYGDPVLHIEAAEQFLAAVDRRHADAAAKGRESAEQARVLLQGASADPVSDTSVDLRVVRVAPADIAGLLERGAEVQRRLASRTQELHRQQRGRQELAAGASLLVVGFTGAGVLAGGMVYRAARKRELAEIAGHEAEYDLTALDAQGRRADAMIGAGAVVTTIGLALGASLMALGARDLRGKPPGQHARLQVAPTLGGMVLSGRF